MAELDLVGWVQLQLALTVTEVYSFLVLREVTGKEVRLLGVDKVGLKELLMGKGFQV